MECYRIHVPNGIKVAGVTASGAPTAVLPGEYLVHRLRPKTVPPEQDLLRFVGADVAGHDVHVPAVALRDDLALVEADPGARPPPQGASTRGRSVA